MTRLSIRYVVKRLLLMSFLSVTKSFNGRTKCNWWFGNLIKILIKIESSLLQKACSKLWFLWMLQVRVKIEGDNEPQPTIPREEGQVPFVFVGTVESISNAKVLLEYHLAHLKVSK